MSETKKSPTSYQLRINTAIYTSVILTIAIALVAIHVGLYLYNYQVDELEWLLLQLFDLDEENNLPTWFSSFLLLNNACFLALMARSEQVADKMQWSLMAVGFLLLAIDEVAGLHETFNSSIEMNWAIPGGILVSFVAIAFIPFLLRLRRSLAGLFILSGFVFISGALIIELISEGMDSDSLSYMMAVAVEEGLEMLGAWLFLRTLMKAMGSAENVEASISIEN